MKSGCLKMFNLLCMCCFRKKNYSGR